MSAELKQINDDDFDQFLNAHDFKNALRCVTCGSVDDGKSTLMGRLLYESDVLLDDQLDVLESESKKWGTQGHEMDFALLTDGLSAERDQGNTIDVAHRFFSTDRRKFIIADAPGLEQYTRNMFSGASTADVAIVLVDVRQGIQTQTRRHTYLASLLGIKHVVLAVNKMDLKNYSAEMFNAISEEYVEFSKKLNFESVTAIPVSALQGDNIIEKSNNMPWYHGTTLLSYLETVNVDSDISQESPFRMPVQWINQPSPEFKGFAGTLASGVVKPGDAIRIQPSGKTSTVKQIVTMDGELESAVAGQSITLTLNDDIDIARGEVISTSEQPAASADQFETTIVWMTEEPLLPSRAYQLKIGTKTVTATVTTIKHQVNVNTLEHIAAKQLELNAIAVCNISVDEAIAYDAYNDNRDMGAFILIDPVTNATVGAGMVHFALRRSDNIHMQAVDVNKQIRSDLKKQKACVVWFTGLSGSGKSTVANIVEKKLTAMGQHTYLLDGDNVRHGLNKDLGFTDADRVENIRRIGEVAGLMVDSGLIVLTAFISPFRSERAVARGIVANDEFLEVFMDTPLSVAEQRDPKGLYKKARRGELKNFTGIDSPYEAPESPEIAVNTAEMTAEEAADKVIAELSQKGVLS